MRISFKYYSLLSKELKVNTVTTFIPSYFSFCVLTQLLTKIIIVIILVN